MKINQKYLLETGAAFGLPHNNVAYINNKNNIEPMYKYR